MVNLQCSTKYFGQEREIQQNQTEQEKSDICTSLFLSAISEVQFLQGRLDTKLWVYTTLRIF